MLTANQWDETMRQACRDPDPERSNRRITQLHSLLSEELVRLLGRASGPNFHSWAVWGSRKAGFTIRQEDLGSAIRNATAVAGLVGAAVGAAAGVLAGRSLRRVPDSAKAIAGCALGIVAGGWTGRWLAIWSRRQAAQLVLAGNKTVLEDIGKQTARFLELLASGASPGDRTTFFAGLRPGASETHGQDRLAVAFQHYLRALDADTVEAKREAMIAGNCEIVHHEHIRLEPYIRGAMPLIIRRCTTQRLMSYDIGRKTLAVGKDVPGASTQTAARDWANLNERMRYIYALFRAFHSDPEVFSKPEVA